MRAIELTLYIVAAEAVAVELTEKEYCLPNVWVPTRPIHAH